MGDTVPGLTEERTAWREHRSIRPWPRSMPGLRPARAGTSVDPSAVGSGGSRVDTPDGRSIAASDIDVVWPDLGGALADYPAALEQALESAAGGRGWSSMWPRARRWRSWWTTRRDGRRSARRCRSSWIGCTPRGPRRGRDDQRRGGPAPCRRRGGDAPAGRRRGRGRLSLLQPAGGRPLRLCRPGPDAPRHSGAGFRPVAEADLRILIGSVLPHLQAGFGGGYKLIFPGTSHRTTLGALHGQGLEGRSDAAGLLGCDAAGNPMRRAIHAAAERLGPCWSISHLIGGPGPGLPRDRRASRVACKISSRTRRGDGSRRRRPPRPT